MPLSAGDKDTSQQPHGEQIASLTGAPRAECHPQFTDEEQEAQSS